MIRSRTTWVLLAMTLTVGCAGRRAVETPSPQDLFSQAQAAAESGGLFGTRDCFTAERKVQELRSRYPYHASTLEGELILADCSMQDGRTNEAIGRWEAFLNLHRGHARSAEVWAKLASAYMALYDDYDRDLGSIHRALNAAQTLLRRYPDSGFTDQAVEVRAQAREAIAKRELYVARFYRREGELLSARQRLQNVINAYPDLPQAVEARKELLAIEKRLNLPTLDEPTSDSLQ